MKNAFGKFKTQEVSIRRLKLFVFEKITINGNTTRQFHRTSTTLYSINWLGTASRVPRLSSYSYRKNRRKCIFNYYRPGVKFHDSSSGNICIRDALTFEGDE